jgi:hypothetical protein
MPWPVACNPSPGLINKVTGGLAAGDGDPERALAGRRRVVFDEAHDGVPVYRRAGTPACDPATS